MKNTIKDVTGEVWGELTIVGLLPSKKMGGSYYKQVWCKCSCGNTRSAGYKDLKKGKLKSCGCLVKKSEVLPGDIYNYWTIIEEVSPYKNSNNNYMRKFYCKCVCGKEKELTLNSMSTGNSKSCGCMTEYKSGYKLVDESSEILPLDINKVNKRNLGNWKIIKELSKWRNEDFSIERLLQIQCSCGVTVNRKLSGIGQSKSCRKCSDSIRKALIPEKDRALRTRLRGRFGNMIARCHNENNKNYKFYGGRGITVCEEWRYNFKAFYDWCILNKPEAYDFCDLEIDRKDNDRGYSPDNCQLITKSENTLKNKFFNMTLEDVSFIRSDKFDMSMCSDYKCSKKVITRIRNYEIFKDI